MVACNNKKSNALIVDVQNKELTRTLVAGFDDLALEAPLIGIFVIKARKPKR
jgi:hypothetical protein